MVKTLPFFPNQLDQKIECIFNPLCEDISENQIDDLINQMIAHTKRVQSFLKSNEFIDIALAERIASTITNLFNDEFTFHSENSRRLIVGAARYFIRDNDAESDFSSILGFDDDVVVLNFVLVEIGREDLKIKI